MSLLDQKLRQSLTCRLFGICKSILGFTRDARLQQNTPFFHLPIRNQTTEVCTQGVGAKGVPNFRGLAVKNEMIIRRPISLVTQITFQKTQNAITRFHQSQSELQSNFSTYSPLNDCLSPPILGAPETFPRPVLSCFKPRTSSLQRTVAPPQRSAPDELLRAGGRRGRL